MYQILSGFFKTGMFKKTSTPLSKSTSGLANVTQQISRSAKSLIVIFLIFAGLQGKSQKTASTGNWNTATTWTPSGVPTSTDAVIIPNGVTLTGDVTTTCASITFNGASATLDVNSGITITSTGAVRLNSSATVNTASTISGTGTLSTGSIAVGSAATPTPTANSTTTLTVTIGTLSVSGGVSLTSYGAKSGSVSSVSNPTFTFASDATNATIGGLVTFTNNNPGGFGGTNVTTFTTDAFTGILNLSNATPFGTLATGSVVTLSSGTVNYGGTAQTAFVTTYNNLTLSGSGAKTFASTPTVNGILSLEGTASVVATLGVVTYGANATLQYNTSTARTTTLEEWPTAWSNASGGVIVKGTGTITLNAAKTAFGVPLTVNGGATLALSTFALGGTTPPTSVNLECGTAGSRITGTGALSLGGNIVVTVTNPAGTSAGASISCPVALVAAARTFTVADEGTSVVDLTMSGNISGAFDITKSGAGTLTLSGASTYTGLTTISAGILKLGATGSGANTPLGTVGSGTIVSASDAALDLGGFTLVTAEALTLNGTGVSSGGALMNSGAATTYNGAITLASGSTIGGNITVGSGGISGSQPLTVAASSSLNLGSGAVSTTDLVIGSGATLTSTSSTLTVTGNFTNNGTFTHNSGTVTLTGGAQTISGLTTFNNLTINGAGVKSVPDNITISGTMTLTSGIINVTAVLKKVIFNAGSSVSVNADKSSFIKGFVEKIGDTDFTFPVGGLVNGVNTYRPIVIAGQGGAASASTSFTAKYYEATNAISLAVSPYFKTETPGSNTLAGVSDFEYWDLTPSQLTPVMTANVTLDWSPSLYPATSTTYVSLRLAHLTGTTGNERWENLSGASGPASFASKTITVNGVSSFSPFTMGSISAAALPVTLTSFTAKPTPDNKVSLGWVTSSEQVNKGFRIERQTTTETGKFAQIGFVATKAKDGNSQSVLTYNFIDNAPKMGASSFYRLVQEDLDGKLTYSDIRVVRINGQSVSMVFPNPSNGVVKISRTADGRKMNIQVIDQSGKIVSQAYNITDANYTMSILQSGFYSVKLMYPETGEQSIQRIVVQ